MSATSSCRGSSDTPAVAPGAVAGKVVEVSGSVAATRNGVARPLAAGAEVFGDDVIDTASGSVVIQLHHNNARWSVESGRRARVDESLAWRLAKQDGSAAAVDHASSAAGREGERTAADTRATTEEGQGRRMRGGTSTAERSAAAPNEAPPAQAPAAAMTPDPAVPVAPVAPVAPPPSPADQAKPAGGGGALGGTDAAAPRTPQVEAKGGAVGQPPTQDVDRKPGAAPVPASVPAPVPARGAPEQQLQRALEAKRAELQRCLGGKLALTLVVRVTKGAPAIELSDAAAGVPLRACLEGVVKQLPIAGLTATTSIRLGP